MHRGTPFRLGHAMKRRLPPSWQKKEFLLFSQLWQNSGNGVTGAA
jgi:hypothetical protein